MLLADMGAEVVRIVRPGHVEMENGATLRSRTQLALDLRTPEGNKAIRQLFLTADVALEGFRPGVMERLELGPAEALAINQRLIYGRMTGWGQDGPRSPSAGHDINYIAITGALHAIGHEDPVVPLNLVGDYGGGALYLALGILAAVMHARSTGMGQVVDCAVCDGTTSLLSLMHGLRHAGRWQDSRQANILDGAAPFYRTYRCKDLASIAVGAIEPQFYSTLRRHLGIEKDPLFEQQHDKTLWPQQICMLQDIFSKRTRDDWATIFSGTDACVSPVNSLRESFQDKHLQCRQSFIDMNGELQPAPVPRFSASPSVARQSLQAEGVAQVLQRWQIATCHQVQTNLNLSN